MTHMEGARGADRNGVETMSVNTDVMIQQLADELGTTTETLWGVLLKQVAIYGYTHVVIAACLISALAVSARAIVKYSKSGDDEATGGCWVIWSVCTAGVAAYIFYVAEFVIAAFINPEYLMLARILGSL